MISGTITGNIGRDAEMKHTTTGAVVMNFSVAVRTWKKDQPTTWVKVEMWGKRAEAIAPLALAGKTVVVSGELELQTYTSKDGVEKTILAIKANEIELGYEEAKAKQETPQSAQARPQSTQTQTQQPTRRAPF